MNPISPPRGSTPDAPAAANPRISFDIPVPPGYRPPVQPNSPPPVEFAYPMLTTTIGYGYMYPVQEISPPPIMAAPPAASSRRSAHKDKGVCPPELEYLALLGSLLVKQEISQLEGVSVYENRYAIFNDFGELTFRVIFIC